MPQVLSAFLKFLDFVGLHLECVRGTRQRPSISEHYIRGAFKVLHMQFGVAL